jgi:hypothetical protein
MDEERNRLTNNQKSSVAAYSPTESADSGTAPKDRLETVSRDREEAPDRGGNARTIRLDSSPADSQK